MPDPPVDGAAAVALECQVSYMSVPKVPNGSFHVKSSGDFHGPPPILLKFGTLVGIV